MPGTEPRGYVTAAVNRSQRRMAKQPSTASTGIRAMWLKRIGQAEKSALLSTFTAIWKTLNSKRR
jgi:hypothetical protein